MDEQLTLDRAEFDAVILDLDGLAAAGIPPAPSQDGSRSPPSSALLDRLRQQGFALGATAAEPSALSAFDAPTLRRCFHTVVRPGEAPRAGSRTASARSRLAEAAQRLEVAPVRAVAVLGRAAAVTDARADGFGLVVGIADAEDGAVLLRAGAHRVVDGLSALRPAGTVLPPSALAHVGEIRAAAAGKHLAVFLDYDGTLTPITGRPEDANLDAESRSALRRLASVCTTAVITGRDLQDVRRRVGVHGIAYAGSHGLDILTADGTAASPERAETFVPALNAAEQLLCRQLANIDGAILERKRFAMAAHYRLVAEGGEAAVEAAVDEALHQHPNLRKKHGKKVFEVLPDLDWDKGSALDWLMERIDADCFPLYIGDDLTDEDAFHAVRLGGLGIIVGSAPAATAARFRLDDTRSVRRFLEALAEPAG